MIVGTDGLEVCGAVPADAGPYDVVFCTRPPGHAGTQCECALELRDHLLATGYTVTPTPDEPPEGTMTEHTDQLGETARAVLAYLRLAGPSTTTEVADVLDMTTDSVGSCLRRLEGAHAERIYEGDWDRWRALTEVDVTLEQLLDAIAREYAVEQEARERVDAQVHRVGYLLDMASGQRAMPKAAERLGMSTAGAWQRLQSWRKAQP